MRRCAYSPAERLTAVESTLALSYWDGAKWVKEPTSTVDTGSHVVQALSDHLSVWAVLGETQLTNLPLVLRDH